MNISKSNKHQTISIFFTLSFVALVLRLYSSKFHNIMVPDYDGLAYIDMAQKAADGHFFSGIAYHPFYSWLLAFAKLWIKDYQWTGMLVSIVAGSITIGIIFLLSKALFDLKTGLIAALLLTLFPLHDLVSTFVFSDATFSLLTCLGLYFGWDVYKKKVWPHGTVFGITMGASYLTRPEGILIFAGTILFLIISFIKERDKRLVSAILAAIITFLLVALPYIIYLKKEIGHWTISGKEVTNLPEMKNEQVSQKIEADITEIKSTTLLRSMIINPKVFLIRYKNNLLATVKSFKEEVGWPILLLAFTGLFSVFIWSDRSQPNDNVSYPLVVFLPVVFTPLLHPLEGRLILPYTMILFILAGYGIIVLQEELFRKRKPLGLKFDYCIKRYNIIILIIILPLALHLGKALINEIDEHREEQAGLQLKFKWVAYILNKISTPEEIIMTREPLQAFYANRKSINLPYGNAEDLLDYAKKQKVSYLVIDRVTVMRKRPHLRLLLAPLYASLEDRVIYTILEVSVEEMDALANRLQVVYMNEPNGIIIYKLV